MIEKSEKKIHKALYLLMLLPVLMFGLMGALLEFIGDSSPLSGFLWGIGIGLVICVAMIVGMFGWEWIKKEASEGKMRPYMLCGLLVAIAISGWFAWGLGDPTCIEQSDDPVYSSCVDYADDDFEVTAGQRWEEFWSKLPVTLIICLLIAYIAHSGAEKNRPKHFKSEKDGFTVGIFPETISVDLDEDGNSYTYHHSLAPLYSVYVMPLEEIPRSNQQVLKAIESSHRLSASTTSGVSFEEVNFSKGEKQKTPYVFGSYPFKKNQVFYLMTLTRYDKMYSLSMHIRPHENEDKNQLDKIFFEFVDSFKFI